MDSLNKAHAAGVRTVLHTGDLGVWKGKEFYLDALAGRLALLDMAVMFVDGNDEDHDQLALHPLRPDGLRVVRPRLYHLPRGFRWVWPGGLRCMALGGGVSLDRALRTPKVDWWPEEELTRGDLERAVAGGPVDLMLTHDCPSGVEPEGAFVTGLWPERERDRAQRHREVLAQVVHRVRPARIVHAHLRGAHETSLALSEGGSCRVTGLARNGDPGEPLLLTVADLRSDVVVRDWGTRPGL